VWSFVFPACCIGMDFQSKLHATWGFKRRFSSGSFTGDQAMAGADAEVAEGKDPDPEATAMM
jgi:hypothetical protein